MKVIIASPYIYDYPTILSFTAMRMVKQKAEEMGYNVIFLPLDAASPIGYILVKNNADILLYGGHATPRSLIGQWIFWHMIGAVGDKVPFVKGKIIINIPACLPARELGPLALRSGARAFMGSEDYMWAAAGPLLPGWKYYNYAADFIDTWVTAHVTFLKTLDIQKAYEKYKEKCEQYARKYETEKPYDWEWHAWAIRRNYTQVRVFTR